MLSPELYYSAYLLIVTIYTIILSTKYGQYPDSRLSNKVPSPKTSSVVLIIFMVFFIGLRPKHRVFVDMSNYNISYEIFKDRAFEFNTDATNIIFDNLIRYLASNGYDIALFFFLIAAIYFIGIYVFSRKLYPADTLYGIIIYLSAFSTFSYGTNGIKAGAAAVIFLCAVAYHKSPITCILLLLASIAFHHSMVLTVGAFVVCYLYRNPKTYIYLWVTALIIAAAHITIFQQMFGDIADESGADYLLTDRTSSAYQFITGFRLDFVFYSVLPIVLGYYIIFKCRYRSYFYNWIYCTYLLANTIWMLCMYASFTNRIAYLSWLLYPVVMTYPFFDKRFIPSQYKALNYTAWGQLGFTLMIEIVYYGLLK